MSGCGGLLFDGWLQCDPAPQKLKYFQSQNEYNAIQATVGTTPTSAQANALAFHQLEMDRAAAAVVRYAMTDTLNFSRDTLYTWLRNMNSIGAELWLAREYLSRGEGATSLSILDAIPNNHNLSSYQADDISRYRAVADLIKANIEANQAASQPDVLTLHETTLNTLKSYIESGGQTEIWVKNILTFYGAHFSPEYVFAIENAEEKNDIEEQHEQDNSLFSVTVSPNPAKNFVNFRVQHILEGSTASLEIVDLNGRVLQIYSDLKEAQTITWNTNGFASGIYFYRLLSDDGKVESGKIILSK